MAPTRRELYRQQTIDEIRAIALRQLTDGGEAAVSLNAIAKQMSVSPAALYRYFDNRDDLLADLVVSGYEHLADHLERAFATGDDPLTRMREVGMAYRAWALDNVNTYRLIFESSTGSGAELAPERIVPAAQRSMNVLLAALSAVGGRNRIVSASAELADQIAGWGERADPGATPAVLYQALTAWSRMHGLVSLEIGHHLRATGVSAELLFASEIDRIAAAGTDSGARKAPHRATQRRPHTPEPKVLGT